MITLEQLRTGDPTDLADPLAYTLLAMVTTCRIALENDSGGAPNAHKESAVATVLELAEAITSLLVDGCEGLARETRRGVWAKPVKPEGQA